MFVVLKVGGGVVFFDVIYFVNVLEGKVFDVGVIIVVVLEICVFMFEMMVLYVVVVGVEMMQSFEDFVVEDDYIEFLLEDVVFVMFIFGSIGKLKGVIFCY